MAGDQAPSVTPDRISGDPVSVMDNAHAPRTAARAIEKSGGGTALDKPGKRASSVGAKEGKSTAGKVETSNDLSQDMHTRQGGGWRKYAEGAVGILAGVAGAQGFDASGIFGDKNAQKGAPAESQTGGKGKVLKKNPNVEKEKKKKKSPGALSRLSAGATGGGMGYTGGAHGSANPYHGTASSVSVAAYSGKSSGLGKSKGAQLVSRVGGPRKLGK